MNGNEQERMKGLLKQALRPVETDAEPERNLWPEMLRRLDERPAAVPWFDWALAAGIIAVVAFFPVSIPMLLYYL